MNPLNIINDFDSESEWEDIEERDEEIEEGDEIYNEEIYIKIKNTVNIIDSDENMCSICYDDFDPKIACSMTPCGHKFHSSCLFQNFEHRNECPLCRTELIKSPEENNEDDDNEETINEVEEDEEEEVEDPISTKQMADKLISLGYTFEDVLLLYIGGSNNKKDMENPRWKADLAYKINEEIPLKDEMPTVGSHYKEYNEYEKIFYPEPKGILQKLEDDIDYIMDGKIAVKYTDTRSYAQVVSSS